MADIPKPPRAASIPRVPQASPKPKAGAPLQIKPAVDKPMGSPKPTAEQLNHEEHLAQVSKRQQQAKGQSQQKTAAISKRARQLGEGTADRLDRASQDGPANNDEHVAKRAAKQVGKDAGKIASGTIRGAVSGGLAGAGAGAAKGLLRTKSFWVVGLSIFLAGAMFYGSILGLLLFALPGDTDSGHEASSRAQAGSEVAEQVSDAYTGNGTAERMLQNVADTAGADFYILTSALAEESADIDEDSRPENGWFGLTDEAVDELVEDLPGVEEADQLRIQDEARWLAAALASRQQETFRSDATRDLAAGYHLAVTPDGRTPIDGQDQLRDSTFDTWVEAVELLPIEDASSRAESIVNRARDWKVGGTDAGGGPVCLPGDGVDSSSDMTVNIPDQYVAAVEAAAAESGFSANLIGAQIQAESNWNTTARSPVGAMGVAQFMPGTWESFGEGGDPWDPEDAIAAQGRYMKYLRDFMEDHAEDEEHLAMLALAGYNAGQGAVQRFNFNLDEMFTQGGYRTETKPYVDKIMAASDGDYTSDCVPGGAGGDVPSGSIAEASMYLAWDERVVLPFSSARGYGQSAAKPEFVSESLALNSDTHTAYFTDCGVFVATVMRSSGADSSFPLRGTGIQLSYLRSSPQYEMFTPSSEGDLQPGDILIRPGHIFIYTGERHSGIDGRSQGASLYTRPPSGHHTYISDSGGGYSVARMVNPSQQS